MAKRKPSNEPCLYDYYEKPHGNVIKLTHTKRKVDVILIPPWTMDALKEMGDKGFLTGQAYIDYVKIQDEDALDKF